MHKAKSADFHIHSGAASIVFAIMAVTRDAGISNDIFHIVFFIVLFSILIQGTLLPFAAEKLDMIDDKEDVLKTFSDYTEEDMLVIKENIK